MGDTTSNCAEHFVLAEWFPTLHRGKFHGNYERTWQTGTDERI